MKRFGRTIGGFRSQHIALFFAAMLVSGEILAEDSPDAIIPAVGTRAPDFTLHTLEDQSVQLSQLTMKSPVVLVVLRGYPGYQCPICSAQVGGLVGKAKEFAASQAKVVLVYPGPSEHLDEKAQEFLRSKELPEGFLFVTDPDYVFTNEYGLRWDAPRETAYPSTFVIDRHGIVRFATISKSHAGRPRLADVLQAVEDAE